MMFKKFVLGLMLSVNCTLLFAAPANQAAFEGSIKKCDVDGFDLISKQGKYDVMDHARRYGDWIVLSPLNLAVQNYMIGNDGYGSIPREQCLNIIDKLIGQGANPLVVSFQPFDQSVCKGAFCTFMENATEGVEVFMPLLDLLIKHKYVDYKKGLKLSVLEGRSGKSDNKELNRLMNLKAQPTLLMLLSRSVWRGGRADEVFRQIVSKSDVNARNANGKTALMYSVESNQGPTRILLENGADSTITDKSGKSAIDYALEYDNMKAAKLIKSFKQPPLQTSSSQTLIPTLAQAQQTSPSTDIASYAGTYKGTYDGKFDAGEFQATVDSNGNSTFWNNPYKIPNRFNGSGKVDSDGTAVFSIPDGPTFSGKISANGAIEGTWVVNAGGQRLTGAFKGNKTATAASNETAANNPIGGLLNVLQGLSR